MIPSDHEEIASVRPRGTSVAHHLVVRGLAAVCVLSMGCIVTEEIDFPDEPDCPPSIVSPAGVDHPIGEIIVLTLGDEVTNDAGVGAPELEFEVLVRDCNVDQALTYNVWLDFLRAGGSIRGDPVLSNETLAATGSATREPLIFQVSQTRLALEPTMDFECHELELFVSSEFTVEGFGREPRTPGDIDTAAWWIAVRRNPGVDVPVTACQ